MSRIRRRALGAALVVAISGCRTTDRLSGGGTDPEQRPEDDHRARARPLSDDALFVGTCALGAPIACALLPLTLCVWGLSSALTGHALVPLDRSGLPPGELWLAGYLGLPLGALCAAPVWLVERSGVGGLGPWRERPAGSE